jgi:hypothetical protein
VVRGPYYCTRSAREHMNDVSSSANRSDNIAGRGPSRPTPVEWPPVWLSQESRTDSVADETVPAVESNLPVFDDSDDLPTSADNTSEPRRDNTDAEQIHHKSRGCTSTTSWRHTLGGRYCEECWPCTDEAMKVVESHKDTKLPAPIEAGRNNNSKKDSSPQPTS